VTGKTTDKTTTGKTATGKMATGKTPPAHPAKDVPKKVSIGPLEKALRAADAQK